MRPGPIFDPDEQQDAVIGPLVRVVQEAADDAPWALIGSASLRLQGAPASSQNLEFIVTTPTLETLEEMLDLRSHWGQGAHLAAQRLHFMRYGVPVFAFADPVFHGPYEDLSPLEVPSLWDARVAVRAHSAVVYCTPVEWELLLAMVLGATQRIDELALHLRREGYDSRLLVRLMREGRVQPDTEEAVWRCLEAHE